MSAQALRFAGYKGEQAVHTEAAKRFGIALERELGDGFTFSLIADALAEGYKSGDLPGMVADGRLDFCYIATLRFADMVPECLLFDLPFIADDRAALFEKLDGPLGDFFKSEIEKKTPHKVLGFWDNGLRHVTNQVRPLTSPEDCEGLVVRTQMSETIGDVFRALGFTPEPMDIKLYQGRFGDPAIHAQDNDLPTIYNFGIHKHHQYVTLTGHILGVLLIICSKETYDGWSPAVRAAVESAMGEATNFQRQLAVQRDDEAVAKLAADGAKVGVLSKEARTAFRAAVAPVLQKHRGTFTASVFEGLV